MPHQILTTESLPARDAQTGYYYFCGWLGSACIHASLWAALVIWPAVNLDHHVRLSGERSVESVQLSFSVAAIAGVPEPLEFTEVSLEDVPVEKIELAEELPEIETPEVVVVENVSIKKEAEESEKPTEQKSSPESTAIQGTAPVNSVASVASETKPLGFDEISPARPVNNPLPVYPADAIADGRSGRVLLRLTISAQGSVTALSVADSSGHPPLDNAALTAVRGWQFEPARQAGQPVEWSTLLPVRFRID